MSESTAYYQHSGAIGGLSPILMLVLGGAAAPLLAWLYAQLIDINPLVYVNFLGTLFFAGVLGGLIGAGAKLGHCRNPVIATAIGAVMGALALYLYWVFWSQAFSQEYKAVAGVVSAFGDNQWVFSPGAIFELFGVIGKTGLWSMGGITPTGGGLYAIWGVEALIIVGGSAFVAYSVIGDEPYCEDCGDWVPEARVIGRLKPDTDAASLRAGLERGDFSVVEQLTPADEGDDAIRFDFASCKHCGERNYLSAVHLKRKVEKGQVKWDEDKLLTNLVISSANYNKLYRALRQSA